MIDEIQEFAFAQPVPVSVIGNQVGLDQFSTGIDRPFDPRREIRSSTVTNQELSEYRVVRPDQGLREGRERTRGQTARTVLA